jgi:hypothetical protein
MRIIRGQSYSKSTSGLVFTVLKIYYSSEHYVKVRGVLSNKSGKIVYETKNYKLFWSMIEDWRIV